MSNNLTTQSPVSDVSIPSDTHNPFNLTVDMRWDLSEVFCTAFHVHKRDYLERNQDLKDHLAKEDRNEKHDEVLISLRDFAEHYMRKTAIAYQQLTGSNFWLEDFNEVIQEGETIITDNT